MSRKGKLTSECNGWGWKAARRESGLWLAWPREPARQGPCGSFLEASHGPPEGPNPLVPTPSTLRRGCSVRASLASVQLPCCPSAEGCFSGRSPPVGCSGRYAQQVALLAAAAGTDAVHVLAEQTASTVSIHRAKEPTCTSHSHRAPFSAVYRQRA